MSQELPEDLRRQIASLRRRFDDAADEIRREPGDLRDFVEVGRYRERVLEAELRRLNLEHPVREEDRPGLLVLLCGTSPQPLLLSHAYARPERVLVVGSAAPESQETVRDFLKESVLPDEQVEKIEIDELNPALAYRQLSKQIADLMARWGLAPERVAVDITGGKKTMVAAAFLAASRLGLRQRYVDGDYNPDVRLPIPGTAKVAVLDDPEMVFRLRELDLARSAFDGERFPTAIEILKAALPSLQEARDRGYVPAEEVAALEVRLAYARACHLVAEGHYGEALSTYEQEPLRGKVEPPEALPILGRLWRDRSVEEKNRLGEIVKAPELLGAYVGLTLWQQRRALAHGADPRFPFLRTYGLVETVMVARVWERRGDIIKEVTPCSLAASADCQWAERRRRDGGDPDERRTAPFKDGAKKVTPRMLTDQLRIPGLAGLCARGQGNGYKLEGLPLEIPAADQMDPNQANWNRLRNDCAHAAGVVPREDALKFIGTDTEPGVSGQILREALLPDIHRKFIDSGASYRPRRWTEF